MAASIVLGAAAVGAADSMYRSWLMTLKLLTVYRLAGERGRWVPTRYSPPLDETSRLLEERRDFEEFAAAIRPRQRTE